MKIDDIKKKILPVLRRHDIKKAGIFGSVAEGNMKKNSDVDILVEIKRDLSLLGFIGLEMELEKALKRKVDLVEYCAIHPLLRRQILRQEVRVI